MRCECCKRDDRYEIMYRGVSDEVYCWYCSKAQEVCCYFKPIPLTKWFRVVAEAR